MPVVNKRSNGVPSIHFAPSAHGPNRCSVPFACPTANPADCAPWLFRPSIAIHLGFRCGPVTLNKTCSTAWARFSAARRRSRPGGLFSISPLSPSSSFPQVSYSQALPAWFFCWLSFPLPWLSLRLSSLMHNAFRSLLRLSHEGGKRAVGVGGYGATFVACSLRLASSSD